MGSIVGKAMDENMKKNQQFMMKNQEIMLVRQIHMQNQMRQRMAAMQMARARDMFQWFGAFYAVFAPIAIAGAKRNKGLLAPLLPLTFILGYQYDLAYGSKMQRMRAEADRIMDDEKWLLDLPHGLPNLGAIEAARIKQQEEDRLNRPNDIFL
ncbi:plasminogen receptor (KT)-like [Liolophura sinensis]|uniref:plasminogen receptor (KT)-like n=1 Tax=Liolophura sinensis TaxID=3198878 RepID=UPI00315956C2